MVAELIVIWRLEMLIAVTAAGRQAPWLLHKLLPGGQRDGVQARAALSAGRSIPAAWGLLQQPLVPPGGSATPAQREQPVPAEGFVVASPDTCPWEQHRVLRGHAWSWRGYSGARSSLPFRCGAGEEELGQPGLAKFLPALVLSFGTGACHTSCLFQ